MTGRWVAPDQPDWFGDAACAETDPDAFFPDQGEPTRAAKRICRGCAVIDECLIYALRMEASHDSHRYGVWGGLSPNERSTLMRSLEAS